VNNRRCRISSDVTIRPIRADDRERWEPLWQGYLDFYRAVLTPEVTERTWAALCDPTSAVHGLVAEQEDHLAGFAHLVLHPTTWATHPTCYLEDLYVAKPWRGGDVARRLIAAVYGFADGFGPASVYWLTQEYNAPARSLYDTLAHRTSFVTGAEFRRKIPTVRRRPPAALGRSPRCEPRQRLACSPASLRPLIHAEARPRSTRGCTAGLV
jgi:GNAT superfamily N-acetyltransferase